MFKGAGKKEGMKVGGMFFVCVYEMRWGYGVCKVCMGCVMCV